MARVTLCDHTERTSLWAIDHADCARDGVPAAERVASASVNWSIFIRHSAELNLASRVAKGETARLSFLVLLKTFQRLGCFVTLENVPRCVVEHIGHYRGMLIVADTLAEYDESGTRRRHVAMIRKYLRVRSFDEAGQALLASSIRLAAARMEDLSDIINVAIEELVRGSFELPGFSTLHPRTWRTR